MSLTPDELRSLREGWDFEAKTAGGRDGRGQVPDSFWETYSAFANTQGGYVLLGAKEHADGSLELRGVSDPERVERELWNLLQNPQKVSANILSRQDVRVETVEGVAVILVHVPRAPRSQRPVYVNGDMFRGTYLRVHEGDRLADRDRVRRLLADAEYETRDEQVVEGATFADLERSSIDAYRNLFAAAKPDHPWHALSAEELLVQLGGTRRSGTGPYEVTVAGLLMFGKFNAITSRFQHYFLDYQERRAEDDLDWLDRVYPDGRWSGNVFDFYRRVIGKLTDGLKVPFQLDPSLYRRDETHVHEAIREALINALVHADYEGRISTLIVKHPAGFTFRNPGTLRIPLEAVRGGGVSDCRNRRLQAMFLHVGLGERAGSGFSRILRAWREQSWRAPSLEEEPALDTTTLRLSMTSLLPSEVVERLDAAFPEFRCLSEPARLAVVTAAAEGRVTNRRLREISDQHATDNTAMFKDLVERGFLNVNSRRGGTYYTAAEGNSASSSTHSGSSSAHSSTQSPAHNAELTAELIHSSDLMSALKIAAQKRAEPAKVRAALLDLCRRDYRSVEEMGRALARSPRTILQHYVRPMVREGLLELRHPDAPNHPDQAYRTVLRDSGP